MLEQASRSRHFPTSFGRNGHAWAGQTHLAATRRALRILQKRRTIIFKEIYLPPRYMYIVRTSISQESPYDVAMSAMLNRNSPPRMPGAVLRRRRLASTSRIQR